MRISTSLIFDRGVDAMQKGQLALFETQQQLGSGTRLLTPADDPVAAGRLVQLGQAQALVGQFGANQSAATSQLTLAESAAGDVNTAIQDAQSLLVSAGNGTLNDSDRASIAVQLQSTLARIVGLANTRDGAGNYLFSGGAATTQPFTAASTGAVYNGDQGRRELQVGPTRTMAVSENGAEIFQRVRSGNGVFTTSAAATNTGGGVISLGQVVNPAAVTPGASYRLAFNVSGTTTTYDVIDVASGTPISTGNAYTSGGAITVGGLQVAVTGAPANGDTFTLAPAPNQDVFKTLTDVINLLNTPVAGAAGQAALTQGLQTAAANLNQANEKVLAVRTAFGARLSELDALGATNQTQATYYSGEQSKLSDLDYAKAASDLAREQMSLQAAQMAFQRTTGLSLFNYLG